ncbi:thioesterase-like superfamily domain-containing protein [Purpureocillium lavendulum]|uniref:Thioesterase-like superfamily domain-containing protein n=1 Tax=Purpureocillium lavendulum TaxID=1247861 RepID=A0AB34FSZ5_9HYPO|nr:thioesterase-like superfamily domain-containing protein [Purpureocillium lavendulum]
MDRVVPAEDLIAKAQAFVTSWWLLVFILVLINIKAFPGIWTIRALYHMKNSFSRQLRQTVASPTAENAHRRVPVMRQSRSTETIDDHPLFRLETISTHAPLAEIDFNMHKSNSTYFTDLDIARIKLVGRIMAPAWPLDRMLVEYKGRDGEMKRERVKGRPALVLGATYTSFKREIKVLARYDVDSRVLAWDSRWLYIGSWFVSKSPGKDGKKAVFASSLSKYIVKKGRITVRPEQFLAESGWIPTRPQQTDSSQKAPSLHVNGGSDEKRKGDDNDEWTWEEIEQHRLKGMAVVGGWADVDVRLEEAYDATGGTRQ